LKRIWAIPVIASILILGLFSLNDAFAVDPPSLVLKWGSFCFLSTGDGCVDPDGEGPLELGDGQFKILHGIAVDSSDRIIVIDTNNNRIQVFDSSGNFLFKFRSSGLGVAADSSDRIIVAESRNNSIRVLDSSGNFLFRFGSSGSGDGQFNSPFRVAVDSSDRIIVADRNNDRIQVFDSSGNFLFKFGLFFVIA